MTNSENNRIEGSLLKEIIFRLRENVILILIITIMAGVFGVVYYKLKKPVYTASETVNYIANYDNAKETDNVSGALNLMSVYVDTMVDFCTSGVVLDRAEYYFNQFLASGKDFEVFIAELKCGDYNDGYDPMQIQGRKYYASSKVSSSILRRGDETEKSYIFTLTVSNEDVNLVRQLTRVFAVAIDQEGRDYFDGVKTYVHELVKDTEGISVVEEGSFSKTILLFIVIGLVISALIVYIKILLDNTVRDKEEFEALTGVNVLAYIEKQENYDARK